MTLLAEQIPEHDGKLIGLVVEPQVFGALDESILRFADRGDPGEITFDIGGEHRHTRARKPLREYLQRHRLARSGRTGDETMPIGEMQREIFRLLALADKNPAVLVEIRHVFARYLT